MEPSKGYKRDERIEQILELIKKFAKSDFKARLTFSEKNDELDAVIIELNTFGEKMTAQLLNIEKNKLRINEIVEVLSKITLMDFSQKITLSENQDDLDAIAVGINTVSEQLQNRILLLKESEKQLRLIVDNVKDYAIIMLDPDGYIKTWNKGAEKIKGYSAKEIIGKHISIMYTEDELLHKEPENNLKKTKEQGRFESEGWRVRKDGSIFFADVIYTALYDENNNFQGFSKITRDITERRNAELEIKQKSEELTKANKELIIQIEKKDAQTKELNVANEELKESEKKYRLVVENVKDYAIITLNADGYITSWNLGAERIKGYSAKEIIGKHISIMYTRDDVLRKEPEHNLKMAREKGRFENEGWRLRKDGSIFFADIIYTALYDENNNFQGFSKITRDVTERKKAESEIKQKSEELTKANKELTIQIEKKDLQTKELNKANEELKESEKKFRLVVENVKDYAIITLDPDGYITSWNLGAERIKGYSAKEIIGKHISIMYTQDDVQRNEPKHNLKMAKKKGRFESEGWRVRKDGSKFFADVIYTALYDENNNFQGFSKITRDITERRNAELEKKKKAEHLAQINKELVFQNEEKEKRTTELITANELLERFIYIASHHLQEPLRTISNFVGLIEEEFAGKLNKDTSQYLEFILTATSKMQTLIKDLLYYSILGKQIKFEAIDCNNILEEVIVELGVIIKESKAKITSAILPVIRGNEIQLKQLFQNLLTNAIKFRKKNCVPEIEITVQEKDTEYVFAIKDNGIGIEEQQISKLFVIFKQLHNATQYPGNGMGLAICRIIVTRHNGKIWVESELGVGSTFYFTLPKEKEK